MSRCVGLLLAAVVLVFLASGVASAAPSRLQPLPGVQVGKVRYQPIPSRRDPALEKAIVRALDIPAGQEVDYTYARVGLAGRGPSQTVVLLSGSYFCGTGGCSALIFDGGTRYRSIASLTLMRSPVLIATSRSRGWRDIICRVGGGGVRARYAVLHFDGRTYPDNPSTAPPLPRGAVLNGDGVLVEDESRPNYGYLRFKARR